MPIKPRTPKDIAKLNQRLNALGAQFLTLSAQGDHVAALEVNRQARALVPEHPQILGDAGLCHLRLRHHDKAFDFYRKACALGPQDANLWDGLAEVCGHMGRHAEVREYGVRSLQLKDAQTQSQVPMPVPAKAPPSSGDRNRQVIAFSLFGDNPRYGETAKLNVMVAQQLLPQWTCRFYVDATVPEQVRASLQAMGAHVKMVREQDQQALSGLMWRFLVLDDPGVDRFLIRDADSLISKREVAAIKAWQQSEQCFHLMRDYFSHTELLLAGMWGGCGGIFRGVREQMVQYIAQGQYLGARVVDQHFLRMHIWPTVKQSLLSHDPVFGFLDAQDFPPHEAQDLGPEFHVGSNLSSSSIGADSALPDGQRVHWKIEDEQGQLICQYATPVHQGQWRADLPGPYAKLIQDGVWRIEVLDTP